MPNATCFLCSPDADLVYARSEDFFAMLGYGPLGEGYSLIATTAHAASMLDIDAALVGQLTDFTGCVRQLLGEHYGAAAITEHGRVGACVTAPTRRHEPHCLHAHRLVFPGVDDVALTSGGDGDVMQYADFAGAHAAWSTPGPYLYSESASGGVTIVEAPVRLPRQFFRNIVALRRGEPELASWSKHPRLDVVEAARRRLGLAA